MSSPAAAAAPAPATGQRRAARVLFLLVLVAAALLRLHSVNWDEGHHLHPDERFISMVEENVGFPKGLAAYFDSARSPLNPYNHRYDSFPYGTLPIFLTKAIAVRLHRDDYGHTNLVGRTLSAIFDLFSIWLAYRIARRFAGRRAAVVAAALLAFSPLAIQLSHYWAVDTFLAALTAATLLGCIRIAQGRSGWIGDAATGAALGLAVSCKITGLALFAAVGIALLVPILARAPRDARAWMRAVLGASARFLVVAAAAAIALRVAAPYMFLGPGAFSFRLDPRYVHDIKALGVLFSSVAGFPPALQWAGRTVWFPVQNFLLWGAAPFFGLAALAGVAWGVVSVLRGRRIALAPLLVHTLFVLAYHGFSIVRAMRYWYPVYPGLAAIAALFLAALARRFSGRSGWTARVARLAPAAAVAGTALCGFAFSRIYSRPVTRVAASDWIYRNVPPPARFANEAWDDGLPLPRPGFDNGPYAGPVLPMFDPDSEKKAGDIVKALTEADWVAVTSNRVYANITRVPDVYPMSIAYYRALFEGRLGFVRRADFSSYPSLGPIVIPDDTSEEQFTVYDHPRVLLFQKTRDFLPGRARHILMAAMPTTPATIWDWEKWPRSKRRVTAPLRPDRSLGARKPLEAARAETTTNSFAALALFYVVILVVGAAAFPIAWNLFPKLADRGAGFARVLGLVLGTYLLAFSVRAGWITNGPGAARGCLLLLVLAGLAAWTLRRHRIAGFWRDSRRLILHGEIAFLLGFLFFAGMRAINPEIAWGEKPMDFSILNILVRTRTLPPSDPWLAGAPLGYYFFGQETIAWLSLITGLSTRYTFNLAIGLIGGLMLQGAFTLGRNWAGRIRGGAAAAALTAFAGNLAGLREWLVNQPAAARSQHLSTALARHLDWHYFWATSRVIRDTINEYPFWNLLFADLHAHVLAMPLLLFVLACGLNLVRVLADSDARWRRVLLSGAAVGLAVAADALTNAWDAPLLAGIVALLFVVGLLAGGRPLRRGFARSAAALAVAAAFAFLLVAPLWVRGGGAPGWGRSLERSASGLDVVTVFGLFFFLAIAAAFAALRSRISPILSSPARALVLALAGAGMAALALFAVNVFLALAVALFAVLALVRRDPEDRLAAALVAAAFFLVLLPQRIYIYDRMNTFFKLYVEAWLLFGVAVAVLAFRPGAPGGGFSRWPRTLRAGAFILAALALFTTVTAGQGAIDRTTSPSAQEIPPPSGRRFVPARGPTLDGLRWLEDRQPGEYAAVLWLRRAISGTPVLLEAQGPSYQDFSRISMFTGLPTVLGWEYHVQQRGNSAAEIERRREDVRQIYGSSRAAAVEPLLRRYHVGYVYVGWLEKKTYPAAGLAKFRSSRDLFELVYENPEVSIYRVRGGEMQDVITPVREAIAPPPAAANRPPPDEPEETPVLLEKPKTEAAPFAGMREPRGAALDRLGRIWIADFGNSRLKVFDTAGGLLGGWGGRGNGTFGLREPCAVFASGGDLYVADTWNGRVQHYTIGGEYRGTASGLYGPRGVTVARDGSVWVTDTGNNRVAQYDSSLVLKQMLGKPGSGRAELSGPVGIAAAPDGRIWVADAGNRRLMVIGPTGFEREVAFPGWKAGGQEPHLVFGDGVLYATDPADNSVFALRSDGSVARRWSKDDQGRDLARPTGVAADRERAILYVVNSAANSVSTIRDAERKTGR